jgi:uncharacterized membrane protein YccC
MPDGDYSDAQRIGALEQDMASVKKAVGTLETESALMRERYHDRIVPEVQKLIIELSELARAVNKIELTIAGVISGTVSRLDEHLSDCTKASERAETNRHSFRREMRSYFVALLVAMIGFYLSQKFHFSP